MPTRNTVFMSINSIAGSGGQNDDESINDRVRGNSSIIDMD
jgi:hypothetical protein